MTFWSKIKLWMYWFRRVGSSIVFAFRGWDASNQNHFRHMAMKEPSLLDGDGSVARCVSYRSKGTEVN